MTTSLRPHHGMCFQFYEGKGYDAAFTDHMERIVSALAGDPSQPVRLTEQTDAVCENCPNNRAGICADRDRVDRYDAAVLRLCGLRAGEVLPYGELTAAVREKILKAGLRRDICGDCCWDAVCTQHSSIETEEQQMDTAATGRAGNAALPKETEG